VKTDTLYKLVFNQVVDLFSPMQVGETMASENELASRLGVSRTTVRKVLRELETQHILTGTGKGLSNTVNRTPNGSDRFSSETTVSPSVIFERGFMEWLRRGGLKPGAAINTLDLARQFRASTTAVRGVLHRAARVGLFEQRLNTSWTYRGITVDFLQEMFEIRELFETHAALAFLKLPPNSPLWDDLLIFQQKHLEMQNDFDARFQEFPSIDDRFHLLVRRAATNRFIDDFFNLLETILIHSDTGTSAQQQERNYGNLLEHIEYIDALIRRDTEGTKAAVSRHTAHARQRMMELSEIWLVSPPSDKSCR
jgi:DNA-binding GntR family transcriptional regulator